MLEVHSIPARKGKGGSRGKIWLVSEDPADVSWDVSCGDQDLLSTYFSQKAFDNFVDEVTPLSLVSADQRTSGSALNFVR